MKRLYVDESVCIGCSLCKVYCRQAHSQSNDLVKSFKEEPRLQASPLRIEERRPVCFAVQCRHCSEPPCVYACLTGALSKDLQSGIVSVDTEKCVGCWTCILACPVGAIARDTIHGKIIKCDLCKGKSSPACAENCPNEALKYTEA